MPWELRSGEDGTAGATCYQKRCLIRNEASREESRGEKHEDGLQGLDCVQPDLRLPF